MTLLTFISDYIGTPTTLAGEIILYTLAAYILLAVIHELFGVFYAAIKQFR